MKILIVATGGTIGSFESEKVVSLDADKKLPVVEKYLNEYSDVDFEIINPINILSENISEKDFIDLFIAISEIDIKNYDGIIVTCGSDNLAYISAYISLLFSKLDFPLYIVATNMVLSDNKANGYFNFVSAVKNIKEHKRGVFVPWKNSDGKEYLFDGSAILPVDLNCDVHSFGKKVDFCYEYTIEKLPEFKKVLVINPYPLFDYNSIDLSDVDIVLHNTYHSGTADTENLLKFKEKCDDKNIKIYIAGLEKGQRIYSSLKKLIDEGINILYDIAYPAAYIMLCLSEDEI